MKLILTAAVDNLGLAGDVVEVKDGYGRNYLVPRGFAIRWTRGGEKQIDGIKRSRDAREIRGLDHASEVREQLEGLDLALDRARGRHRQAVRRRHPDRRGRRDQEGRRPGGRQALGRDRQADQDGRHPHGRRASCTTR